jgi:hypothetical protein
MDENSSIIRTSGGPGVPPDVEAANDIPQQPSLTPLRSGTGGERTNHSPFSRP